MSAPPSPGATGLGRLSVGGHLATEVEVVGFTGDIDLATISAFSEALAPALAAGHGAVVVDLCGTPFMDSTGVAALVAAWRRLARDGRRFAIACPPGGAIYRLLSLVGLIDALAVYPSRDSAVQAITARHKVSPPL